MVAHMTLAEWFFYNEDDDEMVKPRLKIQDNTDYDDYDEDDIDDDENY